MSTVPIALLGKACRIFLERAYPGGPETIPAKKQPYYHVPAEGEVADFLPPSPVAAGICQALPMENGTSPGFAFRLGTAQFPHLKLKVQQVAYDPGPIWVVMVDTHDAFSRDSFLPPPNHPDADAWRELQKHNRQLKEVIETALEQAGLVTFHSLLRTDLTRSAGP